MKRELDEAPRPGTAAHAGDRPAARSVADEHTKQASATAQIVQEVEKKLGPLAELQQISKNTEERMSSLNALAEHVNQKIKALENQKHTVERAVVESNRLNEMIWAMDVQINKLNEGTLQATRTEELIERVEKLSLEVSGQVETGTKARDSFALRPRQARQGSIGIRRVRSRLYRTGCSGAPRARIVRSARPGSADVDWRCGEADGSAGRAGSPG